MGDEFEAVARLHSLKERGFLSEAEFAREKARLLGIPAEGFQEDSAGDALSLKIDRLFQLKQNGFLTEAEFEQEKSKLLGGNDFGALRDTEERPPGGRRFGVLLVVLVAVVVIGVAGFWAYTRETRTTPDDRANQAMQGSERDNSAEKASPQADAVMQPPAASPGADILPAEAAAPTEVSPDGVETEDDANAFVVEYFRQSSGPADAALAWLAQHYADDVDFFGARLERSAILKQKSAYLRRWPLRSYTVELDSMSTRCDAQAGCHVSGILDWTTTSGERNAAAGGKASFDLTVIRRGSEELIVSESSRVIDRN